MKRTLICLAFGFALMAAVPGSAQAAQWTGCGPVQAIGDSTNYVWVTKGGCDEATRVIRSFYERHEDLIEGGSGMSASDGRFDCDFEPGASPTPIRCEADPTVILGLDRAGSDPNEWATPPVVTSTLTRGRAKRMVKSSLLLDDTARPKEKMRVACPERLSRLSFRCHFSWFDKRFHVRGTSRVTKHLRGSSASYSYRYYNRKCLESGGTLRECRVPE